MRVLLEVNPQWGGKFKVQSREAYDYEYGPWGTVATFQTKAAAFAYAEAGAYTGNKPHRVIMEEP